MRLIKYNCNHKIVNPKPDNSLSSKVKKCFGTAFPTKVSCIAHEADTFLASKIDRLDWNLDFHPNGHLVAISFKQHNSAQIRGSVRAFPTTCCVSSPQNDWACLYCFIIILSLQFVGQNATHIAHFVHRWEIYWCCKRSALYAGVTHGIARGRYFHFRRIFIGNKNTYQD